MTERRPNRTLGGVHDTFWDYCKNHELRLQRCLECRSFLWPPTDQCDKCNGQLDWEAVIGTGKLVDWATFEQRYYKELPTPWDTILVELTEGPLFISNPCGFTRADMVMDMLLIVTFIDCEDDFGQFALPVFKLR